MQILPTELEPPEQPTRHRHEPKPARGKRGYRAYRKCLRWDFGFVCPFCLLHEGDLFGIRGVKSTADQTIEHFFTRKERHEWTNVYTNLLLACRHCNNSRGAVPVEVRGTHLLNPSTDTWNQFFRLVKSQIQPTTANPHAERTLRVYRVNAAYKIRLRKHRKAILENRFRALREGPEQARRLQEIAEKIETQQPKDAQTLRQMVRKIRRQSVTFRRELRQLYRAVPADSPERCRCKPPEHHHLPPGLACQLLELP